ncbi:MAG: energy-coupling factor transporter ATPase [Clostridia bacterium]|nr:energy-coupling factor transporter ATPase [Clostridia bacterium]
MPIIFDNVSYVYGEHTPFENKALDGVSFTIEDDMITGLIGQTGSGKSTIAQLCNGLYKPWAGTVTVDGEDINNKNNKKNKSKNFFRVGLVFQYPEYQLFEETVRKDIAYGPKNMGCSEEEIAIRVAEAARFVGFSDENLDKSPFDLSGGQKRRAAIAGVIAMEPKYLILDEPAAGLDPNGRDDILTKLKQYQREKHTSVVIISHSMEDMANYCDRIIVLKKGGVYKCGDKNEIFSDPMALSSLGLSVPQITKLIYNANQYGVGINEPIYTVDAAYDAVMRLISGEEST